MKAAEYLDYKRQRREILASYHLALIMFLLGILAGTMLGITITLQVLI